MPICLWVFPESDFPAWCELVGTPQVSSYAEYMTLIAAAQADLERSGHSVKRVQMTVAEMVAELDRLGLENTPSGRATVVGLTV